METKLNNAQARALLALIKERDEAIAAIEGYVAYLGQDFEQPIILQHQDGFYVAEGKNEEKHE